MNLKEVVLHENVTILEAMKCIDKNGKQFVAITNEKDELVGSVTDGDIRRGILNGVALTDGVKKIMNATPYFSFKDSIEAYKKKLSLHKLKQLPIVNKQKKVIDIFFLDSLNVYKKEKDNKVVLMVGGLGTRLRPLTEKIPKPMLKVGNKPILETIIEGFKDSGFVHFILCVNYKKEIIQSYFQNGEAFGVHIEYIEETKRMGTAGSLSLLKDKLKEPFFVMNGDLLTQINFENLLDFHVETDSLATMCVREYEYQIPFGVIETDHHSLVSIKEKPFKKEYVNAGIYMLNPETLTMIPTDQFYDMPNLFNQVIAQKRKASVFPIREYWMDIGQIADYEQANKDYEGVKGHE